MSLNFLLDIYVIIIIIVSVTSTYSTYESEDKTMTKAELKTVVERLMVDEWTASDSEYQHIDRDDFDQVIKDLRTFQRECDLEPDECIPATMTADELYAIWNEIVDDHWESLRSSIRDYLLGEGNHEFPFNKYIEDCKERCGYTPHPWIYTTDLDAGSPFCGKNGDEDEYSAIDFAKIAMRSPDFNPDEPYYWYDGEQLHSAKNIYPEISDVETIVQ